MSIPKSRVTQGHADTFILLKVVNYSQGPFINYVDKMRGRGGKKLSVFVHPHGMKTVNAEGGGQKMANFCPRSC